MIKGNKCDNCGKGVMYGHNVSHAKNRTRRIFKPNLHKARILIGAGFKTMKLCTKCLRTLKAKTSPAKVEETVKVEPQSVVAAA